MNKGVELISANAEIKEPNVDTNTEQDWYQSLLSFCAQNPSRSYAGSKGKVRFDVIRRKDGFTFKDEDVPQITAYKLRKKYRSEGFRVDMIEVV